VKIIPVYGGCCCKLRDVEHIFCCKNLGCETHIFVVKILQVPKPDLGASEEMVPQKSKVRKLVENEHTIRINMIYQTTGTYVKSIHNICLNRVNCSRRYLYYIKSEYHTESYYTA
jgi:hypothetical protein